MNTWDRDISGNPWKRQLGRETRTHWQLMLAGEQKVTWAQEGEACQPPSGERSRASTRFCWWTRSNALPSTSGLPSWKGRWSPPAGSWPLVSLSYFTPFKLQSYRALPASTVNRELTEAQTCAPFSYAQKRLTANGLNKHNRITTGHSPHPYTVILSTCLSDTHWENGCCSGWCL